ncbi:MAG: ribonuclease III [Roseiflexaceae bacterium]
MASLDTLIARLGVGFSDQRLLRSALVHRSFLHEHPEQASDLASNERLEFLGDAIANYTAAALVFERFPERGEGDLTVLRAALINTSTLAGFARSFGLGAYIRLSKGDDASNGRERDALLADTFEALVAAIALDSGLAAAQAFMMPLFEQELEHIQAHGLPLDYKSRLQQRIQAERNITPRYHTVSVSGPEHRREFVIEVLAGEESLGVGQGLSKQAAAQAAAQAALEQLGGRD